VREKMQSQHNLMDAKSCAEALKIAEWCDRNSSGDYRNSAIAAIYLRELVQENQQLKAKLARPSLAPDHNAVRVDYQGLLGQSRRALGRTEPTLAEMLRQLQDHMQELGRRYYAGDAAAVDEFLQLYCVEHDARERVASEQKGGA